MASSGKARLLYSPQKLGKNNDKKVQEAVKKFGKLMERMKKEGMTAWMRNAVTLAKTKMNKYGFNDAKLKEMFEFDAVELSKNKAAARKEAASPKAAKTPAEKSAPKAETTEEKPKKAPAKKAAPKKEEAAE